MRGYWIAGAATIGLTAMSAAQAQQQRLPRECRQEIVKLCGMDRSKIRACIQQKLGDLSDTCRTELKQRVDARRSGDNAAEAKNSVAAATTETTKQELAYGTAALQKVDFWAARNSANDAEAPLVLFVHGGGWKRGDKSMMEGSAKLSHWLEQGYAVASSNYRLVPNSTVENQAEDVAAATAYFRSNAEELGIDPDRIVLIGHSAGAHLVSLVSTDPRWFAGAGLSMDDVAGIIALDGAGYNVPDQMGENARLVGSTYQQAFGTDPARQKALSPSLHTAAPNAPAFLILHVERDDAERQSKALNAGLQAAGTDSLVIGTEGRGLKGHKEINQKLGEADYPATALVDTFLAKVFSD